MSSGLRLTFLGTGTSVGVPVLTCNCEVCTSTDPRNHRLRASVMLEWPRPAGNENSDAEPGGDGELRTESSADGRYEQSEDKGLFTVLVDTATDFRQQALRVGLRRLDAVLYTHQHADHLLGLDEVRIYNFVQRRPMPLYGNHETMEAIRRMFAYAFEDEARGVPRLILNAIEQPFWLAGRRIRPVSVLHDRLEVYAYRIDGLAYVTDVSAIPAASARCLEDADVLVIDALRREPHPAHFTLDEALAQIERLRPRRAYLTHLSHVFDHATLEAELPDDIRVAYDGLVVDIGSDGSRHRRSATGEGSDPTATDDSAAGASGHGATT